MALSGSDKWYKQARSGIERAGASRAFGVNYWLSILINGVEARNYVQFDSLRVIQDYTGISTASFTVIPSALSIFVGATIIISYDGRLTSAEFAGQIIKVRRRREVMNTQLWIEVECSDWRKLFNRRLVTREFHQMNATAIVKTVIQDYTLGFTSNAVMLNLDIGDNSGMLSFVNKAPSEVLDAIAEMIGGGWYIDTMREVHFFGTAGEDIWWIGTAPRSLTDSRSTLHTFTIEYDFSQIRNRVIAEYLPTRLVDLAVPSRPNGVDIPVESAAMAPGSGSDRTLRIGAQQPAYSSKDTFSPLSSTGATVTADAAVGATSVDMTSVAWVGANTRWCRIGNQVVYFTGTGATSITGIPSSGYGSLGAPVSIDDQVTGIDGFLGVTGMMYQTEKGAEVVPYVTRNDTSSQTTIATIEGGDGVHEYPLSDRNLQDPVTARLIADNQMLRFSTALKNASWETWDMNARAGRVQFVDFGLQLEILIEFFRITRSQVIWEVPHQVPRRLCEASGYDIYAHTAGT